MDTQYTLVRGSVDDVRRHIDWLVRGFSGAGFVLAPSHFIHEDAPLDNVLIAYDRAAQHRKGIPVP
jgi:hypothetical protein